MITIGAMEAATRLEEFAVGTGTAVHVDQRLTPGGRRMQAYLHLREDCPRRARARVGTYATEKMARAAIPGVKACKACRT